MGSSGESALHDPGTLGEIGMDGHLGETRFPAKGGHPLSLIGATLQKELLGSLGCLGNQSANQIQAVRSSFEGQTRIVAHLRLG